jgi:hypothetical protein
MVRKQCPVLELANQMPVRNMDLARAPRHTARKKGSGYENGTRATVLAARAWAWGRYIFNQLLTVNFIYNKLSVSHENCLQLLNKTREKFKL